MGKKTIVILILGALGALTAMWAAGCGSTATATPAFTVHSSYSAS